MTALTRRNYLASLLTLSTAGATTLKPLPSDDRTAPTWFRGAWKLEWAKTKENSTPHLQSIVRDLQTPTVFGSVRIPVDRPSLSGAASFADLDDGQLAILLQQRGGFAGTATFEGNLAVWNHEIDFQPINGEDTAHLEHLSPSSVLEKGLDDSFSELWWLMSSGDAKYLGIKITDGRRTQRMLVIVGDHFVYARNRAHDLPNAKSLTALVSDSSKTRAQIIEVLDCELSYGTLRSGRLPWEIRFSTLPWREGRSLNFPNEIKVDPHGLPIPRIPTKGWSVPINTFVHDDLNALFPR